MAATIPPAESRTAVGGIPHSSRLTLGAVRLAGQQNRILPVANSPYARDVAHVLHPTTDLARHARDGAQIIVRGQGIHVYDLEGKEYIEGMAGLWCAALGFGEEEL